ERMREVAGDRDEAVVRLRVDGDRGRAETRDKAMDQAVAGRIGFRERGQEPGRTVEQLRARVGGAVGLRAADRVPADVAGRSARGRADGGLRRADVCDDAAV